MLDIGHDFKQINPNWFDTMRVTKLPSFEDQFGEDHNTFAGVRQSRLGVRATYADRARRPQDHVRVRAVRHRRRRRPDDVPPASCLRRARRIRRRPDLEPVHGSGRVPQLARVLGTDRHGVLPQRPGALDAVDGEHEHRRFALERPGASGDQGVYADRVELEDIRARFPLPDFSRRLQADAATGATSAPPASLRTINWDDTLDDQFDLSGDATGWGLNLSSNLKLGKSSVIRVAVRLRRRHPELHERLAGRHRHRQQPLGIR